MKTFASQGVFYWLRKGEKKELKETSAGRNYLVAVQVQCGVLKV